MATQKISRNQIQDQMPWIGPALSNNWVNFGGGYDTVGYMKDTMGFVHIRGFIKSGTATAGTLLFTLPAGFRPGSHTYAPGISNPGNVIAAYEVLSSGPVNFVAGNNTYLSLGHLVFKAEN